ncbi:sarcosine oxidase, gamma subunit family [Hartmannibacter diazotrophicus]|uniref:Sarcosine oxidase, gamma subunit family n=1 Tax=Hartmannibacter diazotrophicus TaxID=1482074 RepID=A0A2C9D9J9_9HYPH|nr:sarcosine oxidase subunit gamma family protein [Hartmannibacter diazotrophicus]SON56946.1 sarcosine oxidase, gamma subunit family [Hartmannibacter diazotrophicus]
MADPATTFSPIDLALVQVTVSRQSRGSVSSAIANELGIELPPTGRSASAGDLLILGLGPERWLVIAEKTDGWALEKRLMTLAAGNALVADQSDGRAVFALTGPSAQDVLALGCGLDLDASVFPAGACAGTDIAGIQAFLWRPKETAFRMAVPRSMAQSFAHWAETSLQAVLHRP